MTGYKNFDKYYSLRKKVLGLQDGGKTPVFRIIRGALGKSDKILDVGCGRGMYLVPFVRMGKKVVGLDFNEGNVALLRENGCEAYQCDCASDIPDKFYGNDAVICSELIEHLDPDEAAALLRNIYKTLNKDGILVVTVPYMEEYEFNIAICPECGHEFHRHGHVRRYASAEELRKQVEGAGFKYSRDYVVYPQLGRYRLPFPAYLLVSRLRPAKPGDLIGVFRK